MFVHPGLADRGLGLIGWAVRGRDAVQGDAIRVAERIEKGARPGAIILLHDGHAAARDPGFGPHCLELTLQRLTARGYRCIIPQSDQLRTRAGGKQKADC